jgi:hypothetical protein
MTKRNMLLFSYLCVFSGSVFADVPHEFDPEFPLLVGFVEAYRTCVPGQRSSSCVKAQQLAQNFISKNKFTESLPNILEDARSGKFDGVRAYRESFDDYEKYLQKYDGSKTYQEHVDRYGESFKEYYEQHQICEKMNENFLAFAIDHKHREALKNKYRKD